MNEDRVSGIAKNLGGIAQEALGHVTGDTKSQVEGVINQAAGAARDLYGQAKETPQMPPKRSATARWMLGIISATRRKTSLYNGDRSAVCWLAYWSHGRRDW